MRITYKLTYRFSLATLSHGAYVSLRIYRNHTCKFPNTVKRFWYRWAQGVWA